MTKYIFILAFLFTSSSVIGANKDTEKLSKEAINDALFRLYTELKCPPSYHLKKSSYPYIYCIDFIKYVNGKVFFKFDVFGDYKKYLKSRVSNDKESDFKEILKLVAWDVGIPLRPEDEGLSHGVIGRVKLSNLALSINSESTKTMKEWIKKNSIIYLLQYEKAIWHQLVMDTRKKFHYSADKNPKVLSELLRAKEELDGT